MLVTEFGMVMLARLLQRENAQSAMLVTESGMVMLVRLLQPENALHAMVVTESGMVMLVRLLQSENALYAMVVTESGMEYLFILHGARSNVFFVLSKRTPLTLKNVLLSSLTLISVRDEHGKLREFKSLTPLGIKMLVRLLQSPNALMSMLVTESGMVMLVRLLQP
jgi:hypothetical protein